jgi:hypothetical protein
MTTFSSEFESDLVRSLDEHDALIARCAQGELPFTEFVKQYDSFYPRYALDGHEASPAELEILHRHARRVALHREVWEEVLTRMVRDEFIQDDRAPSAFITPREAVHRLVLLLEKHRSQAGR